MEAREYAKAIAGFVTPALATLAVAVTAGSDGGATITAAEWITAALAAFGTAGTVFGVENRPSVGTVEHVAQDVHPDDLDHDSDLPPAVTP